MKMKIIGTNRIVRWWLAIPRISNTAKIEKLIPTDLAIVILQSCYGTPENKFFDFSEVEIAKMVSGAIVKLFFTNNLDKKK